MGATAYGTYAPVCLHTLKERGSVDAAEPSLHGGRSRFAQPPDQGEDNQAGKEEATRERDPSLAALLRRRDLFPLFSFLALLAVPLIAHGPAAYRYDMALNAVQA
jgi:hypothetical protein